jgi:hypothetical protein
MGVAVFSGMLGVTFFGLFLTPVFYVLLRGVEKRVATGSATSPDISHINGASGRRISESCFARTTSRRFEERPDADRL